MKYTFFGTPRFAEIILHKLIDDGMSPALVVCNPDKPVGRKKVVTSPPTKLTAQQNGIKVLQLGKLSDAEFENLQSEILNLKCAVAVVAAYAKIIPKEVLGLFPKGVIGVHPSLLPKYRGATPIQSVILNGEKETGVTLYEMDEKVDHGPILTSDKLQLTADYTYEKLEEKLARMAGELLIGILPQYAEGNVDAQEQNHTEATFTKKFTTEDAFVDLIRDDPEIVARKIRALNPEPGVYTLQNGKRLKLLEVKKVAAQSEPRRGREDKWVISKTQLEGKNPKDDKIVIY